MGDIDDRRGDIARPIPAPGASPGHGTTPAGTRPPVAVVMPFAGTEAEAREALAALAALRTRDGDTLTLADNSGTAPAVETDSGPAAAVETGSGTAPGPGAVAVVPAPGEHSPARARNAGAAAAGGTDTEWLLFLDADCRPEPDLLDAFFAAGPIPEAVGAVGGEIVALPSGDSLAARYAVAKNFLNSSTHLVHPFRPRLPAANLLVRRAAFDAVGGFREGIRAAEDTDFCWRLQEAGFTLLVRSQARAAHAYRTTLSGLRAQWRGYAAGTAWLGRAYPDFHPEPALKRALRRAGLSWLPAVGEPPPSPPGAQPLPRGRVNPGAPPRDRRERLGFLCIDVVLGLEELRGWRRSNDA